jgi:site-specific recombinase XerD
MTTHEAHLEDALRRRIEATWAPNTRRSYGSTLRLYERFCAENGHTPGELLSVIAFCEHLAAQGRKYATIEHHLAAIRVHYGVADARLRLYLRGLRRTLGCAQTQKAPLTPKHLEMIRWDSGLKGLRDKALILVGFFGALRRSELVGLNIEDVTFAPEGAILTIRKSKTDQEGRGRAVAITYAKRADLCPVRALQDYLVVRRQKGGDALFTRMHHYTLTPNRLSAQSVALILKDYADRIGLDPRQFSGLSLRAGFVTTAALMGASEEEIALQTGHKSPKAVWGYIRRASPFERNAAIRIANSL